MDTKKRHTLFIDDNKKATLTGLVEVISIFDKEIELLSSENRIVIKGNGLTASRLNVEEGTILIEGENISSVNYLKKKSKLDFRGMFR